MSQGNLYFYKMSSSAIIPTKATQSSAGYDIYCIDDLHISPHTQIKVNTNIKIIIPNGYFGKIESRSSLAVKSIIVEAGVIDSDYRGEIIVLLRNHSDNEFNISKYSRIAQLIIHKIYDNEQSSYEINDYDKFCNDYDNSNQRNEGGFGSSGI